MADSKLSTKQRVGFAAAPLVLIGALVAALALQSATTGDVTVRLAGTVEEGSWSWQDGAVWCGPDGALTQSPGASGWLLCVGRALNATTLMIDFDTPIARI